MWNTLQQLSYNFIVKYLLKVVFVIEIRCVNRDTLAKTKISHCNLFMGQNISEVILEKPQDGEHAQGT